MKVRHSRLHGCLEEEVSDFISCLEHEHGLEVVKVTVVYVEEDDLDEEEVYHTFVCSDGSSNYTVL